MMKNFLALLLLVVTPLFAAERVEPGDEPERRARPLLVALPSLDTNDESLLEIRILRGRERVIQQTMMIPSATAAGAVVDVLFTHPEELLALRREAAGLQFVARVNGRVVVDEPFAAIDARGTALTAGEAIGDLREVKTFPRSGRRVATQDVYYDPACMERCEIQDYNCRQWCDPRGDDCRMCDTWYHDCYTQCPIICEEPKSVTTYTVETPLSSTAIGVDCFHPWNGTTLSGNYWTEYAVYTRVDNYQRTEHCNGTYTDTFTGTTYKNDYCWKRGFGCSPAKYGPPYVCP